LSVTFLPWQVVDQDLPSDEGTHLGHLPLTCGAVAARSASQAETSKSGQQRSSTTLDLGSLRPSPVAAWSDVAYDTTWS
jgi:hypothetical protein